MKSTTEVVRERDGTTYELAVPGPSPSAGPLALFSVTPEQIKTKALSYASLKADTPAGLKAVTAAIAECRTMRVGLGKRKKELNEDAHARIKAVNKLHDELVALIESFEEPLQAEKDRAAKAKASQRAEQDRKEREAYEARIRKEQEEADRARKEKDEADRKAREAELAGRAQALSEESARVAAEKEKARLDREAADRIAADAKAEADRRQRALDEERAQFEKDRAELAAEKKRLADAAAATAKAEVDRLAAEAKDEADRLKREADEAERSRIERQSEVEQREWSEFDQRAFLPLAVVVRNLRNELEDTRPTGRIGQEFRRDSIAAVDAVLMAFESFGM